MDLILRKIWYYIVTFKGMLCLCNTKSNISHYFFPSLILTMLFNYGLSVSAFGSDKFVIPQLNASKMEFGLRETRSLPKKMTHQETSDAINNSIPADHRSKIWEHMFGNSETDEATRQEQIVQMSSWLSNEDGMIMSNVKSHGPSLYRDEIADKFSNHNNQPKHGQLNGYFVKAEALKSDVQKLSQQNHQQNHQQTEQKSIQIQSQSSSVDPNVHHEEGEDNVSAGSEDHGDEELGLSGTTKTPPCAHYGRYYCSYKEDYPFKVVTEVTKYYKWPLEKLFRDLRLQVMPSLANDQHGGLVCDSITRIVRPGWSKNTNGRWLVVINTDHYQQYITEVICRHGSGASCNFIPPCYHATCRQRYNTQKLLVIDPWNPYKGPFISEFLFPSCCICYIPEGDSNSYSQSTVHKEKFIGASPEQSTADKLESPSASPLTNA